MKSFSPNVTIKSPPTFEGGGWGVVALGGALLLTMLAYPLAYDQAAFIVGGEAVLKHGAIPYRDFLDTKPPVIFYLYALARFIFGHHVWTPRAFDILWQAATFTYFYRFAKQYIDDRRLLLLTVLLPLLQYVASGYWMTAQAETFAFLPGLILCSAVLRGAGTAPLQKEGNPTLQGLVFGLGSAFLFLLKFTLITVPIAAVVYLLLQPVRKDVWKFIAIGSLTFMVGVGAYLLHLHLAGGLDRFFQSLQWVSNYAALDPLFSRETMSQRYFQLFPQRLIFSFTPLGFAALCIGVYLWLAQRSSSESPTPDTGHRTPFEPLFLLQLAFGLFAVLYERKYFPYHYSRLFIWAAPFAAMGLVTLYDLKKHYWTIARKHALSAVLFVVAIVAFVFFSPLTQVVSQCIQWPLAAITGKNMGLEVQRRTPEYFYADQIAVANRLKDSLSANDQVFFWGNDVGTYFFLDRLPTTICLTNTPFITSWTPVEWKNELLRQLTSNPPKHVIIEHGDAREYISGTTLDSKEVLEKWDALRSWVETNYVSSFSEGHFEIFKSTR